MVVLVIVLLVARQPESKLMTEVAVLGGREDGHGGGKGVYLIAATLGG